MQFMVEGSFGASCLTSHTKKNNLAFGKYASLNLCWELDADDDAAAGEGHSAC